jgi:glycosyltransferase involved in cell wall biosynthesis
VPNNARILFIAYHFPPAGGAGVQRSLKFVRYLPSFGYEPVVVTGPVGSYGDFGLPDETLTEELPSSIDVYRIPEPEPAAESTRWRGRLERWLRLPTAWSEWWVRGAIETARAAGPVDLVFTSMSPFESTRVAATVAAERGVPWVADLRDPWALDEMRVYPTRLHRWLDGRSMRRELGTAAGVIMNTPEAALAVSDSFPELRRVTSIPNGFDATDFESVVRRRSDGPFRIVHTGELHTELAGELGRFRRIRAALGGSLNGVDITTRSHLYLLQAIASLKETDPDLSERIELHLVGPVSDSDRAAIAVPNVFAHGYLPHGEALDFVRSADLLFLPMHDLSPGSRARIVPGKTYEYVASGRPILAAVPEGDARDLLRAAATAWICGPRDVACMTKAIREQVLRSAGQDAQSGIREEILGLYERRVLTRRLAGFFDEFVASAANDPLGVGNA